MAIIVSKIFAGLMSVVMMLSGMLPALFGGREFIDPRSDRVWIPEKISCRDIDDAAVFADYETAKEHLDTESLDEIGEDFFENLNLVVIPVTIPNLACKVFVESVAVTDEKVIVNYSIVRDGCLGATVMSSEIILIAVDKNIEKVQTIEKNAVVPFCVHKSAFSFDV